MSNNRESLIPKHGGYRKLISFQVAQLDYEDFLRQRGLSQWSQAEPLRQELIDRRCQCADEVAHWVVEVARRDGPSGRGGRGGQQSSEKSTGSTLSTLSTERYAEISANAVLVLLAVACSMLERQVARLAEDFEQEGGFSERLYRVRKQRRGY